MKCDSETLVLHPHNMNNTMDHALGDSDVRPYPPIPLVSVQLVAASPIARIAAACSEVESASRGGGVPNWATVKPRAVSIHR